MSDPQSARVIPNVPAGNSVRERLTLRNGVGLWRYMWLRVRFRRSLHSGLFFMDSGADIRITPQAQIRFGRGVRFMRDFTGHFSGELTIGDGVFFNRGCHVVALNQLTIGDHCLFGEMVSIHDENHIMTRGAEPITTRGWQTAPITIGRNVWVGAKATILAGVCIGDNAVIGANAVVTHDIPAYCVAAGIPARVIRTLADDPL